MKLIATESTDITPIQRIFIGDKVTLTLIIICKYCMHGQTHFLFQGSQHRLDVVLVEDSLPLLSGISGCKSLHNCHCISCIYKKYDKLQYFLQKGQKEKYILEDFW